MKKFFSVYLYPLFILLSLFGCSQDSTAIEESDNVSDRMQLDANARLAANPPSGWEGFAHIKLDKQSSLSAQMTKEYAIYDVEYVFDLRGGNLKVPANCILNFTGGSFKNGTVTFNDTYINSIANAPFYTLFQDCKFAGKLSNKEVLIRWFGADPNNKDNSGIINNVLTVIPETLVFDAIYPIDNTIVIDNRVTFRGYDWEDGIYATMTYNAEYGIKTTSLIDAIHFGKGGTLNAYGITIWGNEQLYIGRNIRETDGPNGGPIATCGILITPEGGSLDAMFNCSIVGFTCGIRAVGGYISRIRSSYFSACRFGLWCAYTSDFICQDCRFNTNMVNYDCAAHGLKDDNPNRLRQIGGGVLLKGTGMTQFIGCRFEFNFIHFIIDEACLIMNLQDCIFDTATHSCILFYNDDKENMLSAVERHTPSINCVNISGNTFSRGARIDYSQNTSAPGSGILYIRESNNRGTNFNFTNNVVVDDIEVDKEDVQYENTIFRIYNDGYGGVINSNSNDFSHCKAKTVASAVSGSTGRFTIKDNGSNFGNISHQFQNNTVIDIKKMELNEDGKIVIWNTLTTGNQKSVDIIVDPNN